MTVIAAVREGDANDQIAPLTVRCPITTMNGAMDAVGGLQLLSKHRHTRVGGHSGIECVLPFPWGQSGMSPEAKL